MEKLTTEKLRYITIEDNLKTFDTYQLVEEITRATSVKESLERFHTDIIKNSIDKTSLVSSDMYSTINGLGLVIFEEIQRYRAYIQCLAKEIKSRTNKVS